MDTSIWSLALRRQSPSAGQRREALAQLIREDRAHLIGAVRQELLSGIKDKETFEQLVVRLEAFPDLPLGPADYVQAALYFNTCRAAGIQGSNTDFLICAAAVRHEMAIYTSDKDFARFSSHIPIRLYTPDGA